MALRRTENEYGYEDSRFEKDIDAHFHCSICYNVLKEPMMCRNNEHIFCRACITEHLTVNSQTCPECKENLTVDTLRRAPRLVLNYLSELKMKCEYSSRGYLELIRLEELDAHVKKCDFAPVKCSNEGCEVVVGRRELLHHETILCEYRKVKCVSCKSLEQDVKEMKERMQDVAGMQEDVNQVKAMIVEMFEKLHFIENTMRLACAVNQVMDDIFVAGGFDSDGNVLSSTERFSWKKHAWERGTPVKIGRIQATSFVHENQLFVAGGCDSDKIEVLNLDEGTEWVDFMASLPYRCLHLLSVVCQNRAILFSGCGEADHMYACVELGLTSPYTCKLLCKMPELRKQHAVVAFEHKVLIFGGRDATNDYILESVSEYDVVANEVTVMPSLPQDQAVSNMAAVRWGDQAVLIGGFHEDGPSKNVLMYDSKTGNTTALPSMLEERAGCCAVITGNTVVVMGGRGLNGRVRSVEAFTMGGYSWRYLPAMNDVRSGATATVLPRKKTPPQLIKKTSRV